MPFQRLVVVEIVGGLGRGGGPSNLPQESAV